LLLHLRVGVCNPLSDEQVHLEALQVQQERRRRLVSPRAEQAPIGQSYLSDEDFLELVHPTVLLSIGTLVNAVFFRVGSLFSPLLRCSVLD
jgi:hypothetical protein